MTTKLKISGMHCSGCVNRVRQVLEGESGVRSADVSLDGGEARVEHEEGVEVARLVAAVEAAGYGAAAGH